MANYRSISSNGVPESRRAPRVELMQQLHGQLTTIDLEITVREISLGGLSFEAPLRFPEGAVHEFRLTLGDGSNVIVRGRVTYSRQGTNEKGVACYITGLEFLEDQPQHAPIDSLVRKVTTLDGHTIPVKR